MTSQNLVGHLDDLYRNRRASDAGCVLSDEWRQQKRERLRERLAVPDLHVKMIRESAVEQHDGFLLTIYEATLSDGVVMPVYFAAPEEGEKPYKPILIFHGHADGARTLFGMNMTKPHQDYARAFLRKGYAVISIDQRGFAERLGLSPITYNGYTRSCRQISFFLSMLGKTLLGERVGEALCLIDIVKKLPSLNTDRIVMTGNSGGGTTSLYAAAISDRVDAIMISGSFCGFRESIMELSHCECNYVPGLFHVIDEIWELGALVSPRPFLVIHGEQDAIFPIASVRDQAERVRRLYELGGVPSHFEIATHADGHRYDHGHVFSFLEEQVWK